MACALAVEHAIEPDSTDSKDQQHLFDAIARAGGLSKIPPSFGQLLARWAATKPFSSNYFSHCVRNGCEPIEVELRSAEDKGAGFDSSKLRDCQFVSRRLRDYLADYDNGLAHGIAFPGTEHVKKALERIEAILLHAKLPPLPAEPRSILAECAQLLSKHVYENKPSPRI
jgi:hypothetical protein